MFVIFFLIHYLLLATLDDSVRSLGSFVTSPPSWVSPFLIVNVRAACVPVHARVRPLPPRVPGGGGFPGFSGVFFSNVYLQLSLVVKYSLIKVIYDMISLLPAVVDTLTQTLSRRISACSFYALGAHTHTHTSRYVILHVRRKTLYGRPSIFAHSTQKLYRLNN